MKLFMKLAGTASSHEPGRPLGAIDNVTSIQSGRYCEVDMVSN